MSWTDWIRRGTRRGLAFGVPLALGLAVAGGAGAGTCPSFELAADGLPTGGEWRTHPAFGDVNGDGHLDLAANSRKGDGPRVFLGDGTGKKWKNASTGLAAPGVSCGVGVDLADLNGDGNLDLGVGEHCAGLRLYLGDGKGVWRLHSDSVLSRGRKAGFDDIVFSDFNVDGAVDLVVIGSERGGFSLFLGDGKGGFTKPDHDLPEYGWGHNLAAGDIDGDGAPDFVAAYQASGRPIQRDDPDLIITQRRNPIVWLNDGTGKFRSASKGIPDEGTMRAVALGDVNGDGHLDLALSQAYHADRSPLSLYLGNGGKSWALAPKQPTPKADGTVYRGIQFADFDSDGNLDMIASDHRAAELVIWMGDGKGGLERCESSGMSFQGRPETKPRAWGIGIADVNKDGKPDVASGFGRSGGGALRFWLQR